MHGLRFVWPDHALLNAVCYVPETYVTIKGNFVVLLESILKLTVDEADSK